MIFFSTVQWLDLKVNRIDFSRFELNWLTEPGFGFVVIALSAWSAIGSLGARNFTLCRKPEEKKVVKEGEGEGRSNSINGARKGGSLKAWINKSFNLKVSSH